MHNWKCIWQRKLHSVCVRSSNQYRSVRMNHHRRCWMYGVNIKVVVFETFCGACLHTFMHSTHTDVTRSFVPMHTVNGIIFSYHSCLIAIVHYQYMAACGKKKNIVVAIKAKPVCTAISLSECVRMSMSMSMSVCFLCCFRFLFFCSLFFHFILTHYIRTCIIYIFEILCGRNTFIHGSHKIHT